MRNPKVSIVIPSLNSIRYIEECLENVLNQTLQEIEILCVDANSTDGTLEYLKELESKDKRLKVIVSDKKSYGYQMNLGIKEAKGEYLGIVESDDTIQPTMYAELYRIAKEKNIEVLKCDLESFTTDKKGQKTFIYENLAYDKSLYNKILDKNESAGALEIQLLKETWNMNPPGLYSLNFIRKFRLEFHESAGASYQDTGFWFMMQVLGKRFYYLQKAFYLYRRDNENSSCNSQEKVYCICDEYDFMREFLESLKEKQRYVGILAYLRFGAYNWNLNRIGAAYKQEFLEKFAKDFRNIEAKGELDWKFFEEWQRLKLQRILKDPQEFYKNVCLKPKGAVERVKNQLSYKLGAEIIKCKKYPTSIFALPINLRKILKTSPKEETNLNLEKFSDYYEGLKCCNHLSCKLGQIFLSLLHKKVRFFILPFKLCQIYLKHKNIMSLKTNKI